VSRPALYRRFPSKEDLLAELTARERRDFDDRLRAATAGLSDTQQLDAALRFVAEFQRTYSLRRLIEIEPEYLLKQLALTFPVLRDRLLRYFPPATRDVQASSIARIAFCHFLLPDDDPDRLLAELRQAAGIATL
jgi:AcrR family transcriptional regulator